MSRGVMSDVLTYNSFIYFWYNVVELGRARSRGADDVEESKESNLQMGSEKTKSLVDQQILYKLGYFEEGYDSM